MNIFITGGLGYIGSHTIVELLYEANNIVVLDNCVNSYPSIKNNIKDIIPKDFEIIKGDVKDYSLLKEIFAKYKFDIVIHFASLKSVVESIANPVEYYDNNVSGLINLLKVMDEFYCKKIIFSSSATVYGNRMDMPVKEDCEKGLATNPYGWTKNFSEQILEDLANSDPSWKIIILRYFNPIGAHPTSKLGEHSVSSTHTLMDAIMKVANKELPVLNIYGGDYATKDGTPVRDFIHVVDLARAHVAAISTKFSAEKDNIKIYNVGTNIPYTILEVVHRFMNVNRVEVPYNIIGRRNGDIGISYGNNDLIIKELSWRPEFSIDDMCRDAWHWYKNILKK